MWSPGEPEMQYMLFVTSSVSCEAFACRVHHSTASRPSVFSKYRIVGGSDRHAPDMSLRIGAQCTEWKRGKNERWMVRPRHVVLGIGRRKHATGTLPARRFGGHHNQSFGKVVTYVSGLTLP